MKLNIFLIVCILGVYSCNTPEVNINKGPSYFDIKSFIGQQALTLSKRQISCLKNLSYNSQVEVVKIKHQDSTAWSKDLNLFIKSDIQSEKLQGLYLVDSLTSPKGRKHITYYTHNKKLNTKSMSIIYNKDKTIYMIIIKNEKQNRLLDIKAELTFSTNRGYTIRTTETSKIGKANIYECFAEFNWSGFEN